MHQRFLSWLILCVFSAVIPLRAQAPAAGAAAMPPGLVLVAKVSGTVSMTLNGATTALKVDDRIPQTAKVITAPASSAVLVFSNGATTQLGEDTELVIQEFLQDPFAATIQVANLAEEPTPSRTRLMLNKGELIGNVKKLKHAQGSLFTVDTPVGAAGIRGTTFRIVFRPTATGLAFFSLSTVEGDVGLAAAAAAAGGGAAGGAPAGAAPGATAPGAGSGVSVGGGQEVVITISVDVNPTTGQVTITAPPTVTSTLVVPISAATQAAVVQQAQTMAIAVATTTFTAGGGTGGTGGGGGGTSGSTTGTTGTQGAGGPGGNTNPAINTNPPPATPEPPRLTPGA